MMSLPNVRQEDKWYLKGCVDPHRFVSVLRREIQQHSCALLIDSLSKSTDFRSKCFDGLAHTAHLLL